MLRTSVVFLRRFSTAQYPLQRRRPRTEYVESPSAYFEDDLNPVLLTKLRDGIIARHKSPSGTLSDQTIQEFNTVLHRVKASLANGDVPGIQSCWKELKDRDFLSIMNTEVLKEIARFTRNIVLPSHNHNVHFINDVALTAAGAQQTALLLAWMHTHILKSDPEAVLQLYRQYQELVQTEDDGMQAEDIDEEEELFTSGVVTPHNTKPHNPGEVHILLSAVAACAMRDSFQDAVRLCLESSTRLHHFTTNEFLDKLRGEPVLRDRVEAYTRRLDIIKQVSRPPSLSKHITNLARSQVTRLLEKLYNSILDEMSGRDPCIAPDPAYVHSSTQVSMTQVGWTSFLSAFLTVGRDDLAEKLWDDLDRLKVPTWTALWTALIDGRAKSGKFLEAISTWEMMLSRGVRPDAWTYRAIISALFRGKRYAEAMQKLKEFETDAMSSSPSELQLAVHNTVLHGLLRAGRATEANTVLDQMTNKGPFPDVVSYNTFLAFFLTRLDLKSMAAMVSRMTAANVQGDVVTFSTILSILQRMKRDDAADTIGSLMEKQGVKPNAVTYTAIIKKQIHAGDETGLQSAMQLLQKMEQNREIQPTTVTYTTVLSGLSRSSLPGDKRLASIKFVVERMKRRGIPLDTRTYTILIKSTLAIDGAEALQTGLGYFREMVDSKVPLIQSTWHALLAGLCARKEWRHAKEAVSELYASGIEPGGYFE